jgi:hypothetical protein
MITKKSNPALPVTNETVTMKVTPGQAFKTICTNGIAARNSVIMFAYSVTAFLFNVSKFRDAKDNDYRSVKDAVEYVTKELASQTSVKSGMLDRYIRVGADLYGKLNSERFADLHSKLLKATDADKCTQVISDYVKEKTNVETLADLMRTLGYSTGHDRAKDDTKASPEARATALQKTVESITKALTKDAHKGDRVATRLVAQSVVAAVPDKLELAKQAIGAITDAEDLLSIAKLCNDLADKLIAMEEKATPKAKAKPVRKAKANAAQVTLSAAA